MARDVSGTYTLAAASISYGEKPASSSKMNTQLSDIATALTDSLSRSGKGAMLANLDMGGFDITNCPTIGDFLTEADLAAYLTAATAASTYAPKANPTFSGTITTPLTASRALATNGSGALAASAVTATELGYVSGVTSSIQSQINALSGGGATYGTFTPTLHFSVSDSGLALSYADGIYVKVGRFVMASIYLVLTSKGTASGDAIIGGLPYAANNTIAGGGMVVYAGNMASWAAATAPVETGTNGCYIWLTDPSGMTKATAANFTNTSAIVLSLPYITAS